MQPFGDELELGKWNFYHECFDSSGSVFLRLTNPPVAEVGIDFQFDPDPEKEPWDLPVAVSFIERFRDILPSTEAVAA